jgi:long-chain fatty acid transport protein
MILIDVMFVDNTSISSDNLTKYRRTGGPMKKLQFLLLVSVVIACLTGTAMATNGYQLIGVGQIQKSMGGAVTAAPMDAMTAITNPAGMARIGNRADFSIEAFMPKRSVDLTGPTLGGGEEAGGSELYGIPSIGLTAPAFNRDDVYFGGGMYGTSGLGGRLRRSDNDAWSCA